jgi:hypothetical protein
MGSCGLYRFLPTKLVPSPSQTALRGPKARSHRSGSFRATDPQQFRPNHGSAPNPGASPFPATPPTPVRHTKTLESTSGRRQHYHQSHADQVVGKPPPSALDSLSRRGFDGPRLSVGRWRLRLQLQGRRAAHLTVTTSRGSTPLVYRHKTWDTWRVHPDLYLCRALYTHMATRAR